MFASARTATAGPPVVSPSLKHVLEFAHTHTHTPLVGLGLTSVPKVGQGARGVASSSSSKCVGHGSRQAIVRRPRFLRMQTPDATPPIPFGPRMRCAPALPSVFSPLASTRAQSPFVIEEDYSDESALSENMEEIASDSQSTNKHTTVRNHFTANADNFRSTFRPDDHNIYHEVEWIGLGISGILLDESSVVRDVEVDASAFKAVSSCVDSSPEEHVLRRTAVRPGSERVVRFKTGAKVIVPSNLNDESDGYDSDTEREDSIGPHRRSRSRPSLALNDRRSCKGRVPTPYCGPNGESSWL